MSTFGRITNALLSGVNENNISLATLNFDFSLLKFEAPKEFQPLGFALSGRRRREAEEGLHHRTARRLGVLFEDLIPSTPKLIEAFGKRVSEVVQTPGVNDRGAPTHGPFEHYVGADGTTLWAAATSGIPAIAVYLLSCLLAHIWDAKEATALWVELVTQRRLEIESSSVVSAASLFAARQEITREDLARWDNSARSWLRSADTAKKFQKTQLRLIEKNARLPLLSDSSTYNSVINVWRQAMLGLEALLGGSLISISDGSLFLAFSAWHLFPDLIVLEPEPQHVAFRDKLFPPGVRATVTREAAAPNMSGGLRWSLTFSHLKYYGDPVVASNKENFTRVTFQEFKLVALGSLFHEWRVSPREHVLVSQWFLSLWDILESAQICSQFGWLKLFVDAARDFLFARGPVRQAHNQLVQFGYRKAKDFLNGRSKLLAPLFGICHPWHLAALSEENDWDCGIRYLRLMAQHLGLSHDNAIICYALDGHRSNDVKSIKHVLVATAVPYSRPTMKRYSSGNTVFQDVHSRWFISRDNAVEESTNELFAQISQSGKNKQEDCERLTTNGPICDEEHFFWPEDDIPKLFCACGHAEDGCPENAPMSDGSTCHCFETPEESQRWRVFRPIYGDARLGLYVREPPIHTRFSDLHSRASAEAEKVSGLSTGAQAFGQARIKASMLSDYLSLLTVQPSDMERRWYMEKSAGMFLLASHFFFPDKFVKSMFSLDLAAGVYESLQGASVSLTIVSQPMYECTWIPETWRQPLGLYDQHAAAPATHAHTPILKSPRPQALSLQEAFACITKFECGTVNLEPEDLSTALALCSEDSIFVAAVVLSDPFDTPSPHDIRRIAGNIGQPGISVLVAPQEPQIRKPTFAFNAVAHAPYDFRRENNFSGTSLHLSFTEWKFPLEASAERTIDQEVMVVESVISVLDRGKWVADLDIMGIDFESLPRIVNKCDKEDHARVNHNSDYDYFSLDNWDELVDAPEGVGIFRAHGNWAARLAAVSILSQKGQGHSIGVFGSSVCFKCLEEERGYAEPYLLDHEAPLPSFCID